MQKFKLNNFLSPRSRLYSLALTMWAIPSFIISMSIIPSAIRVIILRLFGAKIGSKVVMKSCFIKEPWNLRVADNSWIGRNCDIDNPGMVLIGRNTCVSQHCKIVTGSHDYKKTGFDLLVFSGSIGNNCWIQTNCTLIGAFCISDNTIVRSNELVIGKKSEVK